MPDKRNAKTQKRAKDALLDLLKSKSLREVSVSELARVAGISRSAFYGNFQNVFDVYRLLVVDFLSETSPLERQLRCSECHGGRKQEALPYCLAVRTTKTYRNVVREPQYLSCALDIMLRDLRSEGALAPYLNLGLTPSQARALLCFQMAGCHNAALEGCSAKEWESNQKVIDAFIAGGMNAVK